jgi:hypothetical protein
MSLNVSAVVVDSAVASGIFALGVAWAPVVLLSWSLLSLASLLLPFLLLLTSLKQRPCCG